MPQLWRTCSNFFRHVSYIVLSKQIQGRMSLRSNGKHRKSFDEELGRTLFLGGFPLNTKDKDVFQLCHQIAQRYSLGSVERCRIIPNTVGKLHRTCCGVCVFARADAVGKALDILNHYEFRGYLLRPSFPHVVRSVKEQKQTEIPSSSVPKKLPPPSPVLVGSVGPLKQRLFKSPATVNGKNLFWLFIRAWLIFALQQLQSTMLFPHCKTMIASNCNYNAVVQWFKRFC